MGMIKSIQNGGLYTEYAYDGDEILTSLKTILGQEVLADNRYSYDYNGNRAEKWQLGGTIRYTYDLFNRTEKVETFDGHIQINHYNVEGLRSGIEENGRLVQFIFHG